MIDDDKKKKFFSSIHEGVDLESSCYRARLNPRVVVRLLEEGKVLAEAYADSGKRVLKKDEKSVSFWEEFCYSRAEAIARNVRAVQEDPKLARWWLESQVSGVYGRMTSFGENGVSSIKEIEQ